MKSIIIMTMATIGLSMAACTVQDGGKEIIITENLNYCESVVPYNDGAIISNFGGHTLNPLNTDGKGYITYLKDSTMRTLVAAKGSLSAPKGMIVKDDYLFVCDLNRIVIFYLRNLVRTNPKVVLFPDKELFVNDVVSIGDNIYVSVTDAGKIYKIATSDMDSIEQQTPELWANVVGANGMATDGEKIYVASYPADGVITDDNVIYEITNLNDPKVERFTSKRGLWDGIALSKDGDTLYASSWMPSVIVKIDMKSKRIKTLNMKNKFSGAADFSLIDGKLYIPDLPNSKLIIKELQ